MDWLRRGENSFGNFAIKSREFCDRQQGVTNPNQVIAASWAWSFGKQTAKLKASCWTGCAATGRELEKLTWNRLTLADGCEFAQAWTLRNDRHDSSAERWKLFISEIFNRMGFVGRVQLTINSATWSTKGHPARDDYDVYNRKLISMAIVWLLGTPSICKSRVDEISRQSGKRAGYCYRSWSLSGNEDLDVRHEHTFYQVEGVMWFASG